MQLWSKRCMMNVSKLNHLLNMDLHIIWNWLTKSRICKLWNSLSKILLIYDIYSTSCLKALSHQAAFPSSYHSVVNFWNNREIAGKFRKKIRYFFFTRKRCNGGLKGLRSFRWSSSWQLTVLSQSDILRVVSPHIHCLLKAVSVNALDILVT